MNPRGETAQDMIGIDIKKTIRPHLSAMVDDMEKSVREKWKESTDILKEISSKEDALQEKQTSNVQLESKMKEVFCFELHMLSLFLLSNGNHVLF